MNKITEEYDASEKDEFILEAMVSRFMECITIKEDNGELHLLCDDKRSLMRNMYNSTLVILRSYEFPQEA